MIVVHMHACSASEVSLNPWGKLFVHTIHIRSSVFCHATMHCWPTDACLKCTGSGQV